MRRRSGGIRAGRRRKRDGGDDPPARVDVRAAHLALYPHAGTTALLSGEGNVVVRAGTRLIRCDSLRFDLVANRLIAAGDVSVVQSGATPLAGIAAYSLDLARDVAVYERLTPEPSTFTQRGGDVAGAQEGPPPPDAFQVQDLDGAAPFARSRHALVVTNANVRLSPATFSTGAGPPVSAPTYLYTFARTNFSQSSLPAASFDQPYPLFGTANSLTAGHLRYDPVDAFSLALDERLVNGNTEYLSTSLIPFRGDRADLNAFQQIQRGLTQSLSGYYLYGPYHDEYGAYALQWTSRSTRTTFATSAFDSSNHASLTLSSIDRYLPPIATYRAQVTYGYDHEPGSLPFTNMYSLSFSGYAATHTLRLPLGIGSTLSYQYGLQIYDFPHQLGTESWTLTFSRTLDRSLSFYGTAGIEQIDDRYRTNAAQYLFLPDPDFPYFAPDGTPWPGFFAYNGLSTLRTYSLQTTWRPGGGENSMQLFLTHAQDFPQFHGYGRPPLFATLDVTQRLGSTLRVDLARSYAFGWDRQYLTQWSIGISP